MDRQRFRPHPWHGVDIGAHAPERLTVYVEIVPTDTVKYEIDKASGYLKVDRPQKFSNVCPTLYGFIPQTYCGERVGALCSERTGVPTRYLFLTGEGGALDGILSLRDLARHLVELSDGTRALPAGADPERARAALRSALDLQLGELRSATSLGHEPVVVSDDLSGADAIRAVWEGGRGYVVAAFPDGAPKGIFTRRDLLRVLSRPFVDLESARLANWMSHSVKTASELDTLYGLLKSMGMEGCRHMPVVDDWDRLECVISMWEALWLLASAG